MRRTSGWRAIASPTGRPSPDTIFTTPGGRWAAHNSAVIVAVSGLVSGDFQHHRIPRHQRRGEVGGGEHEGMIEGDDTAHHAIRLAQHVEMQSARRGRHGVALHLGRQAGEIVEMMRRFMQIVAKTGDGVAGIFRFQAFDLVAAGPDRCGQRAQFGSALPDRQRRPGRLRLKRRGDRAVDMLLGAGGNAPAASSVAGLTEVIQLPALVGDQFAADQHRPIAVFHGADT